MDTRQVRNSLSMSTKKDLWKKFVIKHFSGIFIYFNNSNSAKKKNTIQAQWKMHNQGPPYHRSHLRTASKISVEFIIYSNGKTMINWYNFSGNNLNTC